MRSAIAPVGGPRGRGFAARRQGRLTVFGVAGVVLAAAVAGAALPASSSSPATSPPGAAPVKRLPGHALFPVLGRELRSTAGADIGRIAEVLVDAWGQPRAVVVDFGGFLGIGTRKVAVNWQALRFYEVGTQEMLLADVALNQLQRVPEYEAAAPSIAVVTPGTGADGSGPQDGP
jgi:PRC-barrel domain